MQPSSTFRPSAVMTRYQREVYSAADKSRFVAWCASRQVGKSFLGGAIANRHALKFPRSDFLIASPTMRQSLEALRKCIDWARAWQYALGMDDGELFHHSATTINFYNGSRIISVPGTPDTVRGFSGSIWLDEFAYFQNPGETWSAMLPTITSTLGANKSKSMFITSTPNGISGKGAQFYRICNGDFPQWEVFRTPIGVAASELGIDTSTLRAALGNDDTWAQEYECQFLDNVSVLLPYELIAAAMSEEATVSCKLDDLRGRVYMGVDFGRVNDPSAVWVAEAIGDTLVTRSVDVLRNMDTLSQERIISAMAERATAIAVDYTGPGIGLGDMLASRHGLYDPAHHRFGKVELCNFSLPFKREIFPAMRRMFEAPVRIRVPQSGEIENDLHDMRQSVTPSGEITYAAPRSSEGHADRCCALALCIRAFTRNAFSGTKSPPQVFTFSRPMEYRRI